MNEEENGQRGLGPREVRLQVLAAAVVTGVLHHPEIWGVSMEARELQFMIALDILTALRSEGPNGSPFFPSASDRWRTYEEACRVAGIEGPTTLPVWMRLNSPLSMVPHAERQEVHTRFLKTWLECTIGEGVALPVEPTDPGVQIESLTRELQDTRRQLAGTQEDLGRYQSRQVLVDLDNATRTQLVTEVYRLRGACYRAEGDLVEARRAELVRLRSGREQYDQARREVRVAEEATMLAIAGYKMVSRNRDHEYSTDPSMHPDHVELVNTHTGKCELCATFGVGTTKGPAGLFVPCSYELTIATPSPCDEVRLPGAPTVSLAGVTRFVVLSYGADLTKFTGYDSDKLEAAHG